MPTTEIPGKTGASLPQPAALPHGSDLYDADGWELAFRERHDAPALLLQLQDDLSRSRQREAFWISVVVHLTLVILMVNSPKFDRFLPHRAVISLSPSDLLRQKELTYLELPPDEQKVSKRPDTDKISDKDRVAMSRAPRLDREELKRILDSARPGAPGPGGPQAAPQPPAASSPAIAESAPGQPQPRVPPPAPPSQNQIAQMQAPPRVALKPGFTNNRLSPGSAIEQAARAAIASRGDYGGDNGDYGLALGRQPAQLGGFDVLSDTMGVDFGPYLARVLHDVRENWYHVIPPSAQPPVMKKGKVSIEFVILKDGSVAAMRYVSSSGDVALDRAAQGGITASNPFPPLPNEFGGPYLALRFHFYYNPDKTDLR